MNDVSIIDIGIVVLYLMMCVVVGLHKYRSIKTLREYTLGRGYFSNTVIISTIFATYMGASPLLGTLEKIYQYGIFFIIPLLYMPCFWLIAAKVFGNNIDQFRGCMSISDIMELLYGKVGRRVTNITSVLLSTVLVAAQAKAIGYLLHYFLHISPTCSVIIGILVLAVYSAFGGIRAVALTDVFQFAVFIVILPLICSYTYHNIGGYEVITKALAKEVYTFNLNEGNIWLFVSILFCTLLPCTGGSYIQRFLLSRSSWQLVDCLQKVAIVHLFFIIVICMMGIIIKIKEPNLAPPTAFIYFMDNHLSAGAKGLIIAGLLAVVMSTADSWLNNASALCAHEIVNKFVILTDNQALLVARVCTFIVAILAVFLSFFEKGIMELNWIAGNLWTTFIMVPLVAGFLKFRTNSKSFMVGIVMAIIFTCISGCVVNALATISLMWGIIGNCVGLFGMHYWQKYKGLNPKPKSSSSVYRVSSIDTYPW
ncbi:MAG: sodium:solute symporter family protein [Candidatus Midichloria sp.]|nr:sodium:solute symporter family protein [Candidatus Midichloria sp.]